MRRGRVGAAPSDVDRGQTPQDFALGIGVFVIAVLFAFTFIPSVFSFTGADPGPIQATQADRAASELIANLSVGEHQNQLNATATGDWFSDVSTEEELQAAFTLPSSSKVNLTIRALDDDNVVGIENSTGGNTLLAAGTEYKQDRPAAEVVRIVKILDEDNDCDPACQLVVRVW